MVVEEIQRGLQAGYAYLAAVRDCLVPMTTGGWLPVQALESREEQVLYADLSASLGAGEASCLAVSVARSLTLATDDLAARRIANQRRVQLTGTLGILIRAVREGCLSLPTANGILTEMLARRYRSPVHRLDDLL
jgi:predicted nucleic acid-binding protein